MNVMYLDLFLSKCWSIFTNAVIVPICLIYVYSQQHNCNGKRSIQIKHSTRYHAWQSQNPVIFKDVLKFSSKEFGGVSRNALMTMLLGEQ